MSDISLVPLRKCAFKSPSVLATIVDGIQRGLQIRL